jgi:hypothetical protein
MKHASEMNEIPVDAASDPSVQMGKSSGSVTITHGNRRLSIYVPRRSLPHGGTFSEAEKLLGGAGSKALGMNAPVATVPAGHALVTAIIGITPETGGPPPPRIGDGAPLMARLPGSMPKPTPCQAHVDENEGFGLHDGVMFHGKSDGGRAIDPTMEHFVFVPCASVAGITTHAQAVHLEKDQPGSTVHFIGRRETDGTFHLEHRPDWPE